MSLIHADSFSRYGTSDGVSVASSLARYGWSSSGNIHNRTIGGFFGANHIQLQGGGSGKDAYWAAIVRTISNTSTLGVSFKWCPFMALNGGSGASLTFNPIMRMTLSNDQYIDLVFTMFHTHGGSLGPGGNVYTYIYNMQFRHQGIPLTNPGGGVLTGREISFPSELASHYVIPAGGIQAAWTATFPIMNWVHLDFLFNATTKIFSSRLVFPNGNVISLTSSAYSSLSNGLTVKNLAFYGSNDWGQKLSDLVVWTADSTGLSAFPDSPRNLRVQRILPTANGSQNNWTPSSGSNFSAINETPYSDTQYTAGVGIGSKQTFVMGSLGSSSTSIKSGIHGVQLNPSIMDVGGNTSAAAPIQIINNTETSLGSNITPSRVSYTVPSRIININPQTSIPYTAQEINAMETGFNITT